MTTIKSLMSGLVLAAIFQVYFDQIVHERTSGRMMPKLLRVLRSLLAQLSAGAP